MNAITPPSLPEPLAALPGWWTDDLRPAPGARIIRLGARVALFCERTQRLFELNPAAAQLWDSLADGRSPAEAAGRIAEGAAFVADNVEAWFAAGLLLPQAVARRAQGASEATLAFRVGEAAARVDLYGPGWERLAADLQAAFGQFATRAAAADAVRIALLAQDGLWFMLQDGGPRGGWPVERIAPEIKAVLTDGLARSVGGGAFLLHAALLARSGRGLLISGAPGAGKTTLTLALAASGWAYGSDDVVRCGPDGALCGAPFSPAVKSGAWALAAPYVPALRQAPAHLRADGQQVRYAPVAGLGRAGAPPLHWAVTLARRPGAQAALEPVEPLAMLTALLGDAFCADHRLQGPTLAAFAAQVARADCRRLVYDDLPSAVALLAGMAGDWGPVIRAGDPGG